MQWRIGTITSAYLCEEDHGILTIMVHLDYGSSVQGFGTYDLRDPERLHLWVTKLFEVCGVRSWDALKGQRVYALSESFKIHGIKGLDTGKEFWPEGRPDDIPSGMEVL